MTNSVKNEGIIELNSKEVEDEQRTVVVMGISRSGTSMTALVLDALGVFMGSEKKDASFEDHEVFEALEKNHNALPFEKIVQERNKNYRVWGWKRPDAVMYAEKFEHVIKNPHYIFMFRDHIAISMRNMIANNTDAIANLEIAQNRFNKIIQFIKNSKYPMLLISYEKALQNPHNFINKLSDFLKISPTTEEKKIALKTIQPDDPSYLASVARHNKSEILIGHIDHASAFEIKGWAINKNEKGAPVVLNIYLDGKHFNTIKADQYRKDLKNRFNSSGKHAFNLFLPSTVITDAKESITVDIRFDKTDRSLNSCPITL